MTDYTGPAYVIPPPQLWCGQEQPHDAHIWVQSTNTYASCGGHS